LKINLKKLTKQQIALLVVIALVVLAIIGAVIYFWPYISSLQEEENQKIFQDWVRSFGPWGVIILLVIQVLQIILFFIPGEVIEFSSGLLYGILGGYLICITGQILAILLTYFLVRIFGKALVDKMVDKETMNKVEERHTRAEVLLFFCLLIPGIPKDVFNFVAPYCKVPMWKYIVITLIARFPTVFSSILMGAAILNGEFNLSLVVLIVSATIGICGIIFNKQIVKMIDNINDKKFAKKER
jgi:uncharacterized membrane protein YdjX (TVP38/TMEM64 family)